MRSWPLIAQIIKTWFQLFSSAWYSNWYVLFKKKSHATWDDFMVMKCALFFWHIYASRGIDLIKVMMCFLFLCSKDLQHSEAFVQMTMSSGGGIHDMLFWSCSVSSISLMSISVLVCPWVQRGAADEIAHLHYQNLSWSSIASSLLTISCLKSVARHLLFWVRKRSPAFIREDTCYLK